MTGLREKDGKLIENWYIACLSRELRAKPVQRVIYDRSIVLFRDEKGGPAALPNRCLHRAAELHEGECSRGELRCPYHGWAYNRRGEVTSIPSEGPGFQPPKVALKPYPCIEQDGVVWVWMGDSDATAAPPWRFPMAEDPSWSKYFMITDFDNEVTHLCENFMDVPHTVFVHRGWFRNRTMKEVPMTLEVRDGTVLVTYHQKSDSIGFTARILNPLGRPMTHTDQFILPNITRVDYTFGPDHQFIINSQCTPVSGDKSRVYTYIAFKIGRFTPLFYWFMRFYTRQVIQQDVDIMRNQSRSFERDPSRKFRSTEADEVHLAIEGLREWAKQGSAEAFTHRKLREKSFWI